jgi:hypothetical protein
MQKLDILFCSLFDAFRSVTHKLIFSKVRKVWRKSSPFNSTRSDHQQSTDFKSHFCYV